MTCIVIDDSRAMITAMSAALRSSGWVSACFRDADLGLREAVARRLAGAPFDVAIIDLSEANAEIVQRLCECVGVVALVSGRSLDELEAAAREWGVTVFARKTPADFEAMVAELERRAR